MLKKIISISFIVLYSLLNSGIALSMHFCHGSLAEISVLGKADSCCGDEHSTHNVKKSCCSEKELSLKLSLDQLLTSSFDVNALQTPIPTFDYAQLYIDDIAVVKQFLEGASKQNAPPLFILFCSPILYS